MILINLLLVIIIVFNTQIQIDFGNYVFYVQNLNKVFKYKWNWIYVGHKRGLIKIFEEELKKN